MKTHKASTTRIIEQNINPEEFIKNTISDYLKAAKKQEAEEARLAAEQQKRNAERAEKSKESKLKKLEKLKKELGVD